MQTSIYYTTLFYKIITFSFVWNHNLQHIKIKSCIIIGFDKLSDALVEEVVII